MTSSLLAALGLAFVPTEANAEVQQNPAAPAPAPTGDAAPEGESASRSPSQLPTGVDLSIEGKASYLSPPIRGGTTPFDTGFGGAAGLTIGGVYIALDMTYFLGGRDVSITDHSLFYGIDLGYAVNLMSLGDGRLVLRPQVGGGGVTIYHTDPSTAKVDVVSTASGSRSSTTSDTTSVSSYYVAPAVALMYEADRFLLGVTGNTVILPSVEYGGAAATWLSFGTEAHAGFRF